ncbi:hypothetical protein KZ126_001278 [Salmonella enterica]|nr:hypothetical protein [Salmonella enterica]EHV2057643.1 hypothetical protein [Salmonella enterica]EHW1682672.1 hypothetical protein [Salmonella enterica]EIL4050849.1 hypothetical protein [Salmonella enterica]EIL4066175.1 hypothetical protein [Salmonella enterica]
MSGEKARYRVLRLSHIHNNLWPEGSEVEYDGEPGTALEPLNKAAEIAKAAAMKKRGLEFVKPESDEVEADNGNDNPDSADDGLDKLREEYEFLFNEKPHHNTKAETLREKIADKRAELGV